MNQKVLLLAIGGIIILGTFLNFQVSEVSPQVQNMDIRFGCMERGGVKCIAMGINSAKFDMIVNDKTLTQTNPTTDFICRVKYNSKSSSSITVPHNTWSHYYYGTEGYPGYAFSAEGNQVYTCYNSVTCQNGQTVAC